MKRRSRPGSGLGAPEHQPSSRIAAPPSRTRNHLHLEWEIGNMDYIEKSETRTTLRNHREGLVWEIVGKGRFHCGKVFIIRYVDDAFFRSAQNVVIGFVTYSIFCKSVWKIASLFLVSAWQVSVMNVEKVFLWPLLSFAVIVIKKRVFGNVEVAPVEPIVVRENATVEEETLDSLWVVPEYSGNLTLYDRVYGIKPQGVGKDVLWGKSFLKSVREYKRQHKKMQQNYRIVWGWFFPGRNEFVDRCLNSPSFCWDKSLKKELTKYCNER